MQKKTEQNNIRRIDSLGRVCLPLCLREKYGLTSKVKFVERDGILSIIPVREINFSDEEPEVPSTDYVRCLSVG